MSAKTWEEFMRQRMAANGFEMSQGTHTKYIRHGLATIANTAIYVQASISMEEFSVLSDLEVIKLLSDVEIASNNARICCQKIAAALKKTRQRKFK